MFEPFTSNLPSTIALMVILYIIHRSFHKVNLVGFMLIGVVLILISNYMITIMHVNQIVAMAIVILGYPIFSYLVSSSIKGFRHEPQQELMLPYMETQYPPYR